MSSVLLGEGQPSERLAHACVQLPDGVKVVGVAGERADAIHGLSASCLGGLVFQERTCYVGGALTHEWSALCLEQASSCEMWWFWKAEAITEKVSRKDWRYAGRSLV